MATPRPALGHARAESTARRTAGSVAGPHRPSLVRRLGRVALVGTTTTLTLALLPGTAVADPELATTPEQAAQLAADAGHHLEVVTEQVNEAREVLARQRAAAEEADRAAADAQTRLDALDGQIRQVARTAYTGGDSMPELDLLMTSDSAEDFVSRLAVLDQIAGHTTDVLADVGEAAAAASQAQADAAAAEVEAQRTLDGLTAQETQLQDDIADHQEQVAALTAAQQQAAAAAQHALAAQQAVTDQPAGAVADSAPPAAAPAAPAVAPAPAPPAAAPAPAGEGSGAARSAVQTALAQVGDAYVWGAGGPNAFDCSGLTQYAYAAAGISLPHSSRMQSQMGTAVTRAQLQPGDLIFYYSPVSHVSMYIGNGQMVHASTSSEPVQVVSVDSMGGITAMRRIA